MNNNKWIKSNLIRKTMSLVLFSIGFPLSFLPITVEYSTKLGTESMWIGIPVFIMLTLSWVFALMELLET